MAQKRSQRSHVPEAGLGEWNTKKRVEDKFDSVRGERKKRQAIVEISRDTGLGVLTGIDQVAARPVAKD